MTYKWTFVDPKLVTRDDFKDDVAGNVGGPDLAVHTQRKVIKGLVGLTGGKGDILRLWKHLCPGNMEKHVTRINEAIKKEGDRASLKHADTTADEYITFIGLLRAARCETARGRALWEDKATGYTRPANFDDFMPRARFELLKKIVGFAFADLTTKHGE